MIQEAEVIGTPGVVAGEIGVGLDRTCGGRVLAWTRAANDQGYKDWFFGTPEVVAEKIHRMTRYTGVSYLNCTFNIGQIPHRKIMRSMELFATRVMPHFRAYEPDQASYPRRDHAPDPRGYFAWEEGMPTTFG